jgi:hypothetical protein
MRGSTTTHRTILGRCPLGDRLSHNRHAMRWFVAGLVQKAAAFSGVRVIRSAVACFGSFFCRRARDWGDRVIAPDHPTVSVKLQSALPVDLSEV